MQIIEASTRESIDFSMPSYLCHKYKYKRVERLPVFLTVLKSPLIIFFLVILLLDYLCREPFNSEMLLINSGSVKIKLPLVLLIIFLIFFQPFSDQFSQ